MRKKQQTERRTAVSDSQKSSEISDILTEAESRVRKFFSEYDDGKGAPIVQRKKRRKEVA